MSNISTRKQTAVILQGALTAVRPAIDYSTASLVQLAVCSATTMIYFHEKIATLEIDNDIHLNQIADMMEAGQALTQELHMRERDAAIDEKTIAEQKATIGMLQNQVHNAYDESRKRMEMYQKVELKTRIDADQIALMQRQIDASKAESEKKDQEIASLRAVLSQYQAIVTRVSDTIAPAVTSIALAHKHKSSLPEWLLHKGMTCSCCECGEQYIPIPTAIDMTVAVTQPDKRTLLEYVPDRETCPF